MTDTKIHMRVPMALKGRWVRASRAAGMKLTDWIVEAVEREMSMKEATALPQAAPDTALAQWRARMALSQRAAAEALGASFRTYQQWESGISRQTGKRIDPPLTALLAAAARENGLPPIS